MDSSVLAKKAELGNEQYCPHLFQTVLFHPCVQQAIQPSLVCKDSLPSRFGLNCKVFVISTKLLSTDRNCFSSCCYLLLLLFLFLNKNINLKIILSLHNAKKEKQNPPNPPQNKTNKKLPAVPLPRALGKQQWTNQGPGGLLPQKGFRGSARKTGTATESNQWIHPIKASEKKRLRVGTLSETTLVLFHTDFGRGHVILLKKKTQKKTNLAFPQVYVK